MAGIENLKKIVLWKTDLIDEIFTLIDKKKKKGKKITGWAALKFLDNLFELVSIVKNYKEIANEWEDLDEQEKSQIQSLVKNSLDITDQFAEEFAERLFYISIEVGDFISFIVKAKNNNDTGSAGQGGDGYDISQGFWSFLTGSFTTGFVGYGGGAGASTVDAQDSNGSGGGGGSVSGATAKGLHLSGPHNNIGNDGADGNSPHYGSGGGDGS